MKKKIKGHLWQGRFYSCVIDEDYLLEAIRYVERNPVRANIVRKAWDWKWSSAGIHIGEGESLLRVSKIDEYTVIKEAKWKEVFEEKDKESFMGGIRRGTNVGKGIGGEEFIKRMEKELKINLKVLPIGRPKKE